MYKTIKKIIIIFLIYFFAFSIHKVNASEKKEGIDSFPDSYKPYLLELQKKYPNWKFTALYTNLDWKYVIDNENVFGKNLVPISYSDSWKNIDPDKYNVEVDSGWVDCSRKSLEYCMDPRNFLNEVRIFQFETLSYEEKTNNLQAVEKILYGTEFYNRIVTYLTETGSTITMKEKYSDLILDAAKTSKVSSYHLASRIKQEVGPFLSHKSISGDVPGFEGLYNFYNIGATSSTEELGAIKNGLRFAKDGKGASNETKEKYIIPWNTKQRAITGGGIFIGSSYINIGQNTVYLQKFDVNDERDSNLFWHQYMTNVLAPYSESKLIYNGYLNSGILDSTVSFTIPVYENMPEIQNQSPAINESDYINQTEKVYNNTTGNVYVRSGPSTSYEIITKISSNEELTRIAKGKQSGEIWDRVQLSNGIVGYVFSQYLSVALQVEISSIDISLEKNIINKGDKIKLNLKILPEEASDNEIEFISSNQGIAVIDSLGNITGVSSGKCTIKVKAKNSNIYSNSIEIEVYSPVTDMQIDTDNLVLQVGETFKINAIIYPEDANNKNVSYKSEDSQIASVDKEGKITALTEGITNIIVTSEDSNIEKTINISVNKKIDTSDLSFSDTLNINGNEISGLDYKDNSVKSIKNLISTIYNIEIYNGSQILTDNQLVGTGSKLILKNDQDETVIEYIFILYGDVNGDGKINSVDLLVLQRHILEIKKIDGVFLRAGNINKNGKMPTSLDLLLIQRHILGLKLIEQK